MEVNVRTGNSASEPHTSSDEANRDRLHGFVAATAVLALGAAASVGALGLGYWVRGPGPGFFPLWLGVLLMTLAVLWAVQLWHGENVHVAEPIRTGGRLAVGLVLGGLLITIVLLDAIGFQVAMTMFVLFILLVVNRRRVLESVIVAVICGFGVYVMFANVLRVYLPTADIGFLSELGL